MPQPTLEKKSIGTFKKFGELSVGEYFFNKGYILQKVSREEKFFGQCPVTTGIREIDSTEKVQLLKVQILWTEI